MLLTHTHLSLVASQALPLTFGPETNTSHIQNQCKNTMSSGVLTLINTDMNKYTFEYHMYHQVSLGVGLLALKNTKMVGCTAS